MKEVFYQVLGKKEVEGEVLFQVELNKEHPVYQGHFPDIAVAPGVMLTDMVRTLSETHLGLKLQLKEGKNIKFLQPVLPKKEARFEVKLQLVVEGHVSLKAVCGNENGAYFKVSAIYQKVQ